MAKKNYVFGGIGKASLELREKKNYTQSELAEKVGCSFGTISRWERQPNASLSVRKDFAEKFIALYERAIKRNRVALASMEIDEAELISGMRM